MDLGVVSDFLLAEQTQTKEFLGTIRYTDPSYLTGGQFTATSEWYSVGLIGYELFFGSRILGSEEHWAKIIARKLSGPLPSKVLYHFDNVPFCPR
jgi:serine/threonine protein kinase